MGWRSIGCSTVPRGRSGPPDEGEVAAFERAGPAVVGKLGGELGVGTVGLRHHHDPGGVLVEAMDDAGPSHPADARKALAAVGDQGVHQGAGHVAGGGVDHHPARLVDDDELVVLEQDIERDVLRRRRRRLRRRQNHRDGIAGVDAMARIKDCAAADRHLASEDQRLKPRARQIGNRYGERAVEPIAGILLGDHDSFGAMINGHKFAT